MTGVGGFRLGRGEAYAPASSWPPKLGYAMLRCDRPPCEGTWTGAPGELCMWCVERVRRHIDALTVVALLCPICRHKWDGYDNMPCLACEDGHGSHTAAVDYVRQRRTA